jgi:hypothetical protein
VALRIVRNHNGAQTVFAEDLTVTLGITPNQDNYVRDLRVTKTRVYVLVSDQAAQDRNLNPDGLVLHYKDIQAGATWQQFALASPLPANANRSLSRIDVIVGDDDRVYVLDTSQGEGYYSYKFRTAVVGSDHPWVYHDLSQNMENTNVWLYFAGPDMTFPVMHGEDWLVGWDHTTERLYDIPHPPQIPTESLGPQGQGYSLWQGVVVFAPDDVWAYQTDENKSLPEPELFLGHLIHWNGHMWEAERLPVSDTRVDGFRCRDGFMVGRPGGGFIYLLDSPQGPLPTATWVAVKQVDLWAGTVLNVADQGMVSKLWSFRGSTTNALGSSKPVGRLAALGQGDWGNSMPSFSTFRAFADGSLLIPMNPHPMLDTTAPSTPPV